MNNVSELVICREKPEIVEFAGNFFVLMKRDISLTALFLENAKIISDMFVSKIEDFSESIIDSEWKLPDDPDSQVIEYRGLPVKYSKIRFGVLKAMILGENKPVAHETLCQHGWKRDYVDPDVVADAIYRLNCTFHLEGIPKFVHFDLSHACFVPHFTGKMPRRLKEKRKKKRISNFFPNVSGSSKSPVIFCG